MAPGGEGGVALIVETWTRISAIAQRHGLPILRRVLRRVWRRWDEVISVFDIAQEPRAAPGRSEHTLRVISLDSLKRAEDFPMLERAHKDEVMRRLQRGDLCCVVEVGGFIVGYAWTGSHRWNLDDIAIGIPLANDECYLYDAYIRPQYRGQRIFYPLIRALWEINRARGLQVMYTRTRRSNIAALAGVRFFGTTERLELRSVQLLNLLRLYRATLTTGAGRTISLLTASRMRMGVGLLIWSATGRRGYRLYLPLWRTKDDTPVGF